jgi:hypothetical protein
VDALAALSAHVHASSLLAAGGGAALAALGPTAAHAVEPERLAAALERVRERLLEGLDDPHQKVGRPLLTKGSSASARAALSCGCMWFLTGPACHATNTAA